MNYDDFLDLIASRLTLEDPPEPVEEYQTDNFLFTLFAEEVQGVAVDLAVTVLEDESTLIVLMQSPTAEHEMLYQAVFLPAVEALAMDGQ